MSKNKLNAALENIKAAEKALKTSLLKWSPDYDTAASEYTKAATNFKLGGSLEKSQDAYTKAADMQQKLGSLFHAAKLYTQAAGIASDLKKAEEAVSLMERACSLYRQHGAPDTAALTLSKAGKLCESTVPSKSVELYLQAAELCENDDKVRDAADYLNHAVRMELKQKHYIPSAKIMKQRLALLKSLGNHHTGYIVTLGMVIAYLAADDYVSANNSYQDGFQLDRFGESDEALCGENFLKAFDDGDGDLLQETKARPLVKCLDTEIAKLAQSLKLSGTKVKTSTSTFTSSSNKNNTATSAVVGGKSELEEYEEEYERQEAGGVELGGENTSEDVGDFEGELC